MHPFKCSGCHYQLVIFLQIKTKVTPLKYFTRNLYSCKKKKLSHSHHILCKLTKDNSFALIPGNPDPLVFHVPQVFFDTLQQRISAGSKKKRLPNSTTAFVRKDALPLGTFSKYTWHLTNVLHVKQIFDTPEVSL